MPMNAANHRFTIHALMALSTKFIAALVTYLFSFVLARFLNIDDFGYIGFIMTGALLLSVIGSYGQPMAAIRFLPPLIAKGAGGVRFFATRALIIVLVGTGATSLATTAWLLSRQDLPSALVIAVALIPLLAIAELLSHISRAFGRTVLALAPRDVMWRGIVIIVTLQLSSQGEISLEAILISIVGCLFCVIFGQFVWMMSLNMFRRQGVIEGELSTAPMKKSGYFAISSLSNIVYMNIDVILVGIFIGPFETALYFAANRISTVLTFFQTSLIVVSGPMLSAAWRQGDTRTINNIVGKTTLQSFLSTTSCALALALIGSLVLSLFGDEYVSAYPILIILLIARTLPTVFGASGIVLNMLDQEWFAMILNIISLGIGVTVIVFACFTQDVIFVAWSTTIAITVRHILLWIAAWRLLGIRTDVVSTIFNIYANFISSGVQK